MSSTDLPVAHPDVTPGASSRGTGAQPSTPGRRARPVAAVLASMTSVQLGAAISISVFGVFGPIGTTWLRLGVASAVLLLIARPWRGPRDGLLAAAGLGAVTAVMMASFSMATDRIPLAAVVAIEFCGPLGVAALGARGRDAGPRVAWLAWPAIAAAGVLVLTHPWSEGLGTSAESLVGVGFAAVAAIGWAGYILLTAHVGRQTTGLGGLSVALGTAALLMAPVGLVQAAPALGSALSGSLDDLAALGRVALAALLVPLFSYALEMGALRNVDTGVFGVWMSLEPAIAAAIGFLFLAQGLGLVPLIGIGLVMLAGAGAQRAGNRRAGNRRAGG